MKTRSAQSGIILLATTLILRAASAIATDVGTLLFCPDKPIAREDSLWVVETEATDAQRDSLTIPPQIMQGFTPQPAYPDSALAQGIPGHVIVAAYISKQGDVMAWQTLRVEPQGWEFEHAVEKVICGWRFAPATRQGKPVNARVGIPFNFELQNSK